MAFQILRFQCAFAVAVLMLSTAALAQDITAKSTAALQRVFGESATVERRTATLDDAQIASVKTASGYGYGTRAEYYAVSVGGRRVGYGIVDEVRGKSKLITYLLIVDNNLTVKDLEVLVYREPYGGEIQYEAFRNQFRGKGPRDRVRVGSDIKNISGATISSNAVTNGVRKLLAVLKELKTAGELL
jgi:Na+-translocating ferredoxin:NAD+ oxidoreductase RnfG subunit